MTLRDLPPVRALAEERANDLHLRLFGRPTDGERLAQWREAHLDLLTDLSRADSRDALTRLVAGKVGADLSGGIVYTLTQRTEGGRKIKTWVVCDCNGDDFPVLADTKIMDPIEALQAMALAVLA